MFITAHFKALSRQKRLSVCHVTIYILHGTVREDKPMYGTGEVVYIYRSNYRKIVFLPLFYWWLSSLQTLFAISWATFRNKEINEWWYGEDTRERVNFLSITCISERVRWHNSYTNFTLGVILNCTHCKAVLLTRWALHACKKDRKCWT